jgi:hypothetical protein
MTVFLPGDGDASLVSQLEVQLSCVKAVGNGVRSPGSDGQLGALKITMAAFFSVIGGIFLALFACYRCTVAIERHERKKGRQSGRPWAELERDREVFREQALFNRVIILGRG